MLEFSNESKEGQNHRLHLGETVALEGTGVFYLQIEVNHDTSYQFQSRAKCSVWNEDTLTWNTVSHLLASEVHGIWEAADELRARALAVLIHEDMS